MAGAGHRTDIIEQGHVGGSCANVGCMPTKTMIASARAAYDIHNGPVTVDMAAVRQRKRYIVNNF